MDPCMQISEVLLKVCCIGLPRQPVHPGGGVALEHEERLPEQIDAEVVEERGELLLPPLLSCLPYASERLGHTSPTLCPVCALPAYVPLGPRPWLRRLRRRFAWHCSSASRLLWRSQTSHGRASSASAPRLPDADQSSARYERCRSAVGPPGSRTRSVCTCQGL